jgi:hypothetical protein
VVFEKTGSSRTKRPLIDGRLESHFYAQLAADIFRRPVACFAESYFVTSTPEMFDTNKFHRTNENSEAAKPMPLILQHVNQNHWITFKMKTVVKMLWPRPHASMWNLLAL